MKNLICLAGFLLLAVTTYAQDCQLNDEAHRYWVRAQAALNEAKSEDDYLNVCEEFKKAFEYAPDCADICYNIAACYEKSATTGLFKDITGYAQAMKYFKKYLELKPNAQNKETVQNKIYELEYKYDKLHKYIGKYGNIKYKDPTNYYFINSVKDFEFEIKLSENDNQLIVIVPRNNTKIDFNTLEVKKRWDMGAGNDIIYVNGDEGLCVYFKNYRHYDYDEKKNDYKTKDYAEFDCLLTLKRINDCFKLDMFGVTNFHQYKNNKIVKGISDKCGLYDGLSITKIE